jgi:hypothetical protein
VWWGGASPVAEVARGHVSFDHTISSLPSTDRRIRCVHITQTLAPVVHTDFHRELFYSYTSWLLA